MTAQVQRTAGTLADHLEGIDPKMIEIESYVLMDERKGYRRFRGTMADVQRWAPTRTMREICDDLTALANAGFVHTTLRVKGE